MLLTINLLSQVLGVLNERPQHGGNRAWAAAIAHCSPDALLDFSASINPLGPPETAIAAIHGSLADLVAYPDPSYSHLRVALSEFHHIAPEYILPGNGAAELLTWAGRELATLEATHLVTPAFGDYGRSLRAFDSRVISHPLLTETAPLTADALAQTIAAIAEAEAAPNSGILLNNPHNPTGQLVQAEVLRPLLERFALVVVDEAFMDFLPPAEQTSVLEWVQTYPNLVVLRSLTKFYSLPGLRLGYAIAQPERLQRWQHWRDPWSVNSLAVAAGIAVIRDQAFQAQTWAWLPPARSQLLVGLSQQPGLQPLPGTANFLLVKSESSVVQLQRQLLQQDQILIRDCLSFPELGDRYFRVAVRTEAENARLLQALATLDSTEGR